MQCLNSEATQGCWEPTGGLMGTVEGCAGRAGEPQGLRWWAKHWRAASDFLATKTPGFW